MREYKTVVMPVCDDQEFIPVVEAAKQFGGDVFNEPFGETVSIVAGKTKIIATYCGCGKSNAACVAAALCQKYSPDAVISIGMSGGLKGTFVHDLVLGSEFVEHDFDLSPIGYKPGEKPLQQSVFYSDNELNEILAKACPKVKYGNFATGDTFVCETQKKQYIVETFKSDCCDMETAAVAQVCFKYNIPFAALRYCSDSADEQAYDCYKQINNVNPDDMIKVVIKAFEQL